MSYIRDIIAKRDSEKLLRRIHEAISESLRRIEEKKTIREIGGSIPAIDSNDFGRQEDSDSGIEIVVGTEIGKSDGIAPSEPKRPPISRGGRPRVRNKPDSSKDGTKKTSQIKPEIICWQRERLWFMGIEVPEELLNIKIKYVNNKVNIIKDDFNEARLILNDINDSFTVEWINDKSKTINKLSFEKKESFLFKLSGRANNAGRLVKHPTNGSYLVFAPMLWERDVGLSGQPPISPQNTLMKHFRVHFSILIEILVVKFLFEITLMN